MSNLKDTDIDDLFRRASDKYPLRTDSANWDRMAAALDKEPPFPPDAVDADEKRKKRRFFWLFLLLPLAGAGYYAWHHAGSGHSTTNVAATHTPTTQGNKSDAQKQTGSTTSEPVTASSTPLTAASTPVTTSSTPVTAPATPWTATATTHNHFAATRKNNTQAIPEGSKPDNSPVLTAANIRQQPGGEKNSTGENDRLFFDLQPALIPHDYQLSVDVKAPATKKDSVKPKPHIKHFYAGILGAPDLSTVRMQTVKGAGSTFGVLLGYTFNGGRWAIETGAYVDRKKYYTDGEYFNTKEVRLPSNADLLSVDGVCYMWEIPLNVRYNFNPGAKTSWFATAGFSTYLMSREKYAYAWKWYSGSYVWDSTWNIKKPSQYPFSIFNLSAGFEQRLGKIGNLRVEPYVRLPLTGLGTGKLSIMSTGINIGFTRKLW